EAVNAKDPDMFTLADDVDIPDDMIDRALDVMERWPRLMLGRGEIGLEPVAAVWVPDDDDRYALVGHLTFHIDHGVARLEVVDELDPELTTAPPPGLEIAEWESAAGVGEGWVH